MATIHPKTSIGHVHLKVSDINKALKFYVDILGFQLTTRIGKEAAFISAGGYHHHIGLNTWHTDKNSKQASENSTGLYHFAILLPSRKELAKVIKRLIEANYPIDGTGDHGVSEAVYLSDPDGNGLELYVDRDKKDWPKDEKGNLVMYTKSVDVDSLLGELKE